MKLKTRKSKVKTSDQRLKIETLRGIIRSLGRVVIAYSGGLDSTFLLKIAIDTLGKDNVLAVTARSETYPEAEYADATRVAKKLGAKHLTIETRELSIPRFRNNPANRCYYCKRELFRRLTGIAKARAMNQVIDGANFDDLKDVRHGMKAGEELGVRSPLLEARIGKELIRKASRRRGLETWSKPSFACLASRFPVNEKIEENTLRKIDAAEGYLRGLGIRQVRVRVHGPAARIETYKSDIPKAVREAERITAYLKRLGFSHVSLDLEGYRTGSMNVGGG